MKEKYYKPSGEYSTQALVIFAVLCLTAYPLLGVLYAYLTWYIPIIYINIIVAVGFGFGIALTTSLLVFKRGKVRNILLGYVLILVGALVAQYVQWVVWADLAINSGESYGNSRIGIAVSNVEINQVLYLLTHPKELWDLVSEINQYGTWSIKGKTVTGIFLLIVWLIEFGIVTVVSVISSVGVIREPFCEQDQEWFKSKDLAPMSFIKAEDEKQFIQKLENEDSTALDNLQPISNFKEESHSIFTIYSSEQGVYYLSVENKKAKIKKKKVEFSQEDILEYINVTKETVERLEQI